MGLFTYKYKWSLIVHCSQTTNKMYITKLLLYLGILVRAVKGLHSGAGMVSICPLL